MSEFILSQTCLKDYEDGCPRKWYGRWIEKSIPFYQNEKMKKGSYFEYLCLGGGAMEEDITDLPRKRNGEKTADHLRIEKQAEWFKEELFNPESELYFGEGIQATQEVIWNKAGDERGVLDIRFSNSHIGDLKLTSNVNETRHKYHWGHDENIDTTQADFYSSIEHEKTGIIPVFTYLVFDYSTRMGVKSFAVQTTPDSIDELEERKSIVKDAVKTRKKWGEIPSKMACSSCPLKCSSRISEFKYNEG